MNTPYQEPVLVSTVMYPVRATNKAFNFLSGIWGFRTVIAPLGAAYALALGVEAVYLSIPTALEYSGYRTELASEEAKRDMRFVPKIGIDDGAKLSRVLPLRQTGNLIGERTWAPGWFVSRFFTQERNIWDHPFLFLFAFGVSATIQYYERQIQAPKKLQDKKAAFARANSQKQVKADPNAIPLARLRAAEVNSHGSGEVASNALCVALVYGLEFAAFLSSFKSSAASFPIVAIYCAYTIFGFELFMGQSNEPQLEDVPEPSTKSPKPKNETKTNQPSQGASNKGKPVSSDRPIASARR